MPKKKELKYKLGLYNTGKDRLTTICDETGKPILITKSDMSDLMQIHIKLKELEDEGK